ncbi:acetylglutamate kinase [Fructilactobacillus frigidiflavus]|uniref:acetylglutamate kinase n=1 Tax=Fructilactobacillus frigidiflavus TaxID=3242688 RepID=UPI003757FB1C
MIVIKIGGNLVSQLPDSFFQAVKTMIAEGQRVVIIHGGGNLITEASDFVGLPTQKINGIRVTSQPLMAITNTVLAKIIQPAFAQQFIQHGIACQPLNQASEPLFAGDYLDQSTYGEVGVLQQVNEPALQQATEHQVALAAPIIAGPQHQNLNVNADYAAINVASLTGATQCILLTDVPGVLINEQVVPTLNEVQANEMIEKGNLTGGMVPKVKAAFQALHQGVTQINITNDLKQAGTVMKLAKKEK